MKELTRRSPRLINLTGKQFGRLLVLGLNDCRGENGQLFWDCLCSCGILRSPIGGQRLRSGHSRSCGCLAREQVQTLNLKHGRSRTGEYISYHHAKARCSDPNQHNYNNYGGRGIEFRFNSFEEFLEHLGPRPSSGHSLDRFPDNNGHYESGNVRWATSALQCRNKRDNRYLEIDGITQTFTDWAIKFGIRPGTAFRRDACGWCPTCAVSLPKWSCCPHKTTAEGYVIWTGIPVEAK